MGSLILKKQNLTNLFDYNANRINNNYVFEGGTVNTIGAVFNKDEFVKAPTAQNSDRLGIFPPNGTIVTLYYVSSVTNEWTKELDNTNATNIIIEKGSRVWILYRISTDNTPRSVNSGAIIQKYYQGKTSTKTINTGGGKISLFFDTLPLNTQSIRLNLGYELDGCGNDFVLTQNGVWSQSQNGCDYFVRWDNKNGTLPYRWRLFYTSDGRTDRASHPTAGPDSLPKKGWSNGMTISII